MGVKSHIYYFIKTMDKSCKEFGIVTRPLASNGLWLSCLVPFSYMINTAKLNKEVTFDYKITTIVSFGLLLQSIDVYCRLATEKNSVLLNAITKLLPGSFTSFLIWICLKQNIVFSLTCGFIITLLYDFLYMRLMKSLPKSFTLGEGSIVAQGISLFLFNAFLQLPSHYVNHEVGTTELDNMKPVLQIGLLGIAILITLTHFIPILRKPILFYPILILYVIAMVAIPTPDMVPQIYVLIDFITHDPERMLIISIYSLLLVLAVITVAYFSIKNLESSTSVRKIFHILIILVYIPGLIYQCTLLYISSVLMLAVFIMLETIRIIALPPFHDTLNKAVETFIDEKDSGLVAFTPIYLLVGCSIPLWVHPLPCDITDSAGFELLKLLSGILSVGIGDMAASVVGAKFGKHKWPNSIKSIEGTLASIVFQCITIAILWALKFLALNRLKIAYTCVAIIANALVEARTDQVDNLMLPLITFCILSLS